MNIKKFIRSFGFAIEGLKLAVMVDQNVRFHLIVGILVFITAILLKASKSDLLFVIFAIFFVVITEMINTAIEEMTNLILKEHSQEAKIAKDVAAGAVLLAATFAVIVGFAVLVPKLLILFASL
jgi:diacylglycerol kinase